jgi:hypothetical protein
MPLLYVIVRPEWAIKVIFAILRLIPAYLDYAAKRLYDEMLLQVSLLFDPFAGKTDYYPAMPQASEMVSSHSHVAVMTSSSWQAVLAPTLVLALYHYCFAAAAAPQPP